VWRRGGGRVSCPGLIKVRLLGDQEKDLGGPGRFQAKDEGGGKLEKPPKSEWVE